MKNIENIIQWLFMFVLMVAAGFYLVSFARQSPPLGSTVTGQDYTATSTPLFSAWSTRIIDSGPGSLGSIVITTAGSVGFILFDATTQVSADNYATSTRRLASIPTNATAGTYIFDVEYNTGLYLYLLQGTTGTSTITYR